MRLGASLDFTYETPKAWLRDIEALGTTAVVWPASGESGEAEKAEYMRLARERGLVMGEVGVWNNILDPDPAQKKAAVEYNVRRLALAEEIGARCCVNIAGAKGTKWAGFYPKNYAEATYTELVETIRGIIDAVSPQRTFFTLEPMQWIWPDSPDSYLKLIGDVDRGAFAVHLDYANMINGIPRYLDSNAFIAECFAKLKPYIRSVHVKDVLLDDAEAPCCIKEVMLGEGGIDLPFVLRQIKHLPEDMPIYVEHYHTLEEYQQALRLMRKMAEAEGVPII